ncbi:hypothetical protein CDAR_481251 [Caerostris darwini]|uniref:Uncharacterized protein n=1 Tax=Caerostris darwini TaxID=1538125 RepID=A0AAV4NA31_9ARAC|nr:hypothetical protein CDAR_481251 [Caerostris darwini]
MEDQQLRETEYNVLENDLTTSTSILAKQPNDEIHEIKHFHCLPRTSNSKKSFNFYGNAKFTIPTPDLNSFSTIDKNFKSFPTSSESRNVSANDTDEAKDGLLRAYLGDNYSFNNMGENFQCIKVENGKFIESNRNSQIMHPFTSGGKTDFNYNQLRSKALSDHVGSDYKKGIEPLNNPESNKLINRNSSEPFIVEKESDPNHLAMTPEDALSMKVNVSIQSLKEKESEMNKDSTLIEGLTSNKNIVCYCNLDNSVGNVRHLSTQNVWPGTFKSEELVLPNGNILKCESLLQAETFSDVSYIRSSNVKGLVKVSYAEENFLKRLTVVAQLEGRGLMTRYSFNDRDEKIEVYADGVWECKLMNGTAVDIAKSKEQHKSLEVPLYIKTMVYANNGKYQNT